MTSPLLHRFVDVAVDEASVTQESRTVTFVASTEALDSYGTIVKQDWDLTRFEKNPIVLWNHNRNLPIGTAEAKVEGDKLIAVVTFDDVDPEAIRVAGLVKRKVVRGMSVGFRAGVTSFVDAPGGCIPVYSENQLYELSIAPLPSNEESLSRADELSHQERTMAGQAPTPAQDPTPAPKADTLSRAEHEGLLRDARNTHDTAIRAMQTTVDEANKRATAAEEKVAKLEKRVEELDEDRLVRKLDQYQGKKFAPNEREEMLETLRDDEGRFDRMMAKRADIVGPRVIPDERALDERATATPATRSGGRAAPMKRELQQLVDENMKRGMSRNDALTAAVRSLGKPSEIV